MGLATDATSQRWPQVFRQHVVSNSRYWLNCVQEDLNSVSSELPQVLTGLRYALSLAEAWQWARDLMIRISPFMIRQGQGAKWESFLNKSIARSSEEKDPAEIELRLQLGNLYRLQGRLSEAQRCFQEALNLCEQHKARTHYWALINLLGLVARLSAQYKQALAYCQQVLTEQSLPAAERAEALNVMGLVAYDQRQWEEALHCFDQALALYRSLDDAYQMARILNNRGLVLLRSGDLDEARESYQAAIQQFQASDDQTEIFKAVMNLGNVFLMKKDYKAAIQQYQEALPVFEQCSYLIDLLYIYNNLGMAYTGLADWEVAEPYFLAAFEIARNLNNRHFQANILDNLGKMLINAEQPKRAYKILGQALEVISAAPDTPATARLRGVIEDRLAQARDRVWSSGNVE